MTDDRARRGALYVVSCRKPPAQSSARREAFRNEVLTVPKRAGTYLLFQGPLDLSVEERDLVAVQDTDTDIGEQGERPRAGAVWHQQQESTEDRIARLLWAQGPLVLYVHGFNTKAADALRAAVRLQHALDEHHVGATVVVFTWPSAGHLLDYFPDQKAAGRFGSYALVNLLVSLRRTAPDGVLHCVAHSMGTYVVTRALSTISILRLERLLPGSGPVLSEVAFMNPDIDYDILCSGYTGPSFDSPSYLEIADGYGATAQVERLTIYCTTNDVALFASLFKNRTKRLGAYGPGVEGARDRKTVMSTRIRPNVYVINCDEWCVFDAAPQHSHSHFLYCPGMMTDLVQVLARTPPAAFTTHAPTDAPRWDRLRFQPGQPAPSPGLLRGMAAFWGGLGTIAVNPVAVRLVLWKKRVQRVWDVARGVIPVLLAGSTGMLAWVTRHPFWRAVFVASVAALLSYVMAWLRARVIQKREDALPIPAPVAASGVPSPQPAVVPARPAAPSVATGRAVTVGHPRRPFVHQWSASKTNEHVVCSLRSDSSPPRWTVRLTGSEMHKDQRVFPTEADAKSWIEETRDSFERQGWTIRP